MSAHGIDQFNFEHWEGPPPRIAQQHSVTRNRPGAQGVALQLLGKWGDPFEVMLTSHWASTAAAADAFYLMNSVVGTGWLMVKYANMNYSAAYSTGYHAVMIEQVDLRMAALLIGPGYAYTNGGVLVTRWTLQPEVI